MSPWACAWWWAWGHCGLTGSAIRKTRWPQILRRRKTTGVHGHFWFTVPMSECQVPSKSNGPGFISTIQSCTGFFLGQLNSETTQGRVFWCGQKNIACHVSKQRMLPAIKTSATVGTTPTLTEGNSGWRKTGYWS